MTTEVTDEQDQWWDEEDSSASSPARSRRRARRRTTRRAPKRWTLRLGVGVAAVGVTVGGVAGAHHAGLFPSPLDGVTYPDGLTGAQVASDAHGEYVQITPAEGSSLLTWDGEAEHVNEMARALYPSAELAEAQKLVAEFVVEEAIDSPLVFDPSPGAWDQWVAEHEHLFVEGALDQHVPANGHVVDSAQRDFGGNDRGRSAIDGDAQVRLRDLDLQLVAVGVANVEDIRFDFRATYAHDVVGEDGQQAVSHNDHSLSYTLTPDRATGTWLIREWDNHFGTFTDWPAPQEDPAE